MKQENIMKWINHFIFFTVKEDLLQFESLKEKHHQEYNMKEREVSNINIFFR